MQSPHPSSTHTAQYHTPPRLVLGGSKFPVLHVAASNPSKENFRISDKNCWIFGEITQFRLKLALHTSSFLLDETIARLGHCHWQPQMRQVRCKAPKLQTLSIFFSYCEHHVRNWNIISSWCVFYTLPLRFMDLIIKHIRLPPEQLSAILTAEPPPVLF